MWSIVVRLFESRCIFFYFFVIMYVRLFRLFFFFVIMYVRLVGVVWFV